MSTPKAKIEKVTIAALTELAQNLFRMREFKAESPHIAMRKGFIEVTWQEEYATGQASFSQHKVTVSMGVSRDEWRADDFKAVNPWQLWALEIDPAQTSVKLSVSYTHWDRGSNGWSTYRQYKDGTLKPLDE